MFFIKTYHWLLTWLYPAVHKLLLVTNIECCSPVAIINTFSVFKIPASIFDGDVTRILWNPREHWPCKLYPKENTSPFEFNSNECFPLHEIEEINCDNGSKFTRSGFGTSFWATAHSPSAEVPTMFYHNKIIVWKKTL